MEEEKAEKGFVIKDRRLFDETGEVRSASPPEDAVPRQDTPPEVDDSEAKNDVYLPEINFTNFILSLSTTVMYHFGDFPDPSTQKPSRNLQAAKHTIDTIGMLKAKTEGNLDADEKNLLDSLLFELRMRYVKEANPQ